MSSFQLAVTNMNPIMTYTYRDGWTCLHNAALFGQFDVFQFISENVVNINPKSKTMKITPFHLAAQQGYFKICKLIIDAVEDLDPKDHSDLTPYDYALERGNSSDICVYIAKVRSQRNGVDFTSTDESMLLLKAEGGWPYKNMASFFTAKNNDPDKSPCILS